MSSDQQIAIIFHGKCLDGFTAAYAAWLKFIVEDDIDPKDIAFHPYRHDDPPPDVTGKDVYILDFSFPPETMTRLAEQAKSILLLDHHSSAQQRLQSWSCACARLHFDLNKSGASLAWQHFHPNKPVPALVRYVEDQDLLRFHLPGSRDFNSALTLESFQFDRWHALAWMDDLTVEKYIMRGHMATQCLLTACADSVSTAHPIVLAGRPAVAVNAQPFLASDIGAILSAATGQMAVIWQVNGENVVEVSLRGGDDLDEVAAAYGGGGNGKMSAFRMPLAQWTQILEASRAMRLPTPPADEVPLDSPVDPKLRALVINKMCVMASGRQSIRNHLDSELLVVNAQASLLPDLVGALSIKTGLTVVTWAAIEADTVRIRGQIAGESDVDSLADLCRGLDYDFTEGQVFSGTMPLTEWSERLLSLEKPDDVTIEINTRPMALA